MGITKTDGFKQETINISNSLKALGHPARFAIIEFLSESPSCICNDIVEELPLAQPTISRHLAELKQAGLIQGNIEGKNICYCINPDGLKEIHTVLGNLLNQIEKNTNCCK
ncbi:MAG: winged helix-turn-helix transcriptional regulator [Chitinophagales bacterium]|nr:winged helix-turn-helix transcriptional regulator [Chitinophagales bacterium]